MNKRGQFYLIAAFFVIIIFSGLMRVYIDVNSPEQYFDIGELAKEIHFEGNHLINNKVIIGSSDDNIAIEIKKLLDYYISRNPDLDIKLVFGNVGNTFLIDNDEEIKHVEGVGNIVNVPIGAEESREIVLRNEQSNFFVIIIEEKEGEKRIIVE